MVDTAPLYGHAVGRTCRRQNLRNIRCHLDLIRRRYRPTHTFSARIDPYAYDLIIIGRTCLYGIRIRCRGHIRKSFISAGFRRAAIDPVFARACHRRP